MSEQNNSKPKKGNAGKSSLIGFASGAILTTGIVAAVILMIQGNSKKDFQAEVNQPKLTSTPPTQDLTPSPSAPNTTPKLENNITNQGNTTTDMPTPSQQLSGSGSGSAPSNAQSNPSGANNTPATTQNAAQNPVLYPNTNQNSNNTQAPIVVAENKNTQQEPAVIPQVRDKNAGTIDQIDDNADYTEADNDIVPVQPKKNPPPKPKPKPTNTQVPKKAVKPTSVEETTVAEKQPKAPANKGAVVLQAGSFNTKDYAESQRAKLALMGVPAQITTATVNGKTVYRVQTSRMNSKQASETKAILNLNGVQAYERSK